MKQNNMANLVFHFCKSHASGILAVIASVGVVATGVEAAIATVKAKEVVDELKEERHDWEVNSGIPQPDITKEEIVKACWKLYIPSAIIGTATVSCILAANIISAKQQKSIAAAYALIDKGYKEYRKKISEQYGKDVDLKTANEVIMEQAEVDEEDKSDKITCYDPYADRYFETTLSNFNRAVGIVNRNLQVYGYASLNDFYQGLGISMTEEGSTIGWNIDVILEWMGYAWIDFSMEPSNMGNGEKCYVIESLYVPSLDYIG